MSETELTLAEAARRSQETFRAREAARSMVSERGPYLTRVTVAGNRLSDLIDALRWFDPDTRIGTQGLSVTEQTFNGVRRVVAEHGVQRTLL